MPAFSYFRYTADLIALSKRPRCLLEKRDPIVRLPAILVPEMNIVNPELDDYAANSFSVTFPRPAHFFFQT
jgi:hypothetical protein